MKLVACLGMAVVVLGCQPRLPSDLPGLMRAMGDYDMRVSFASARRVAEVYGKDGLLQALNHPSPNTRSKAAHFLACRRGHEAATSATASNARRPAARAGAMRSKSKVNEGEV